MKVMRKKIHKKWKKGDIALIRWESLDGEPGQGYARCVVIKVQKRKNPEPGKSPYKVWVRDPNGREWQGVDWMRKGVRRKTDEEAEMSDLRHADYSRHLVGKTIKQVRWFNAPDEDFRNLSVWFTDDTQVSFRFKLSIEEEAELADFKHGDLSNERLLHPVPVKKPKP